MTVTVWSFVIRRVTYCTVHKKIRQNSDKNNTTLRKSTRFIKLHLSEVDFLAPGVKLRLRGSEDMVGIILPEERAKYYKINRSKALIYYLYVNFLSS